MQVSLFASASPSTRRALIGGLLIALMVATRGHHFPSISHILPTAAWAVFFLGGVYLRSARSYALFLATAAAIDYVAITWGGVSDFCISPAYVALLHAYGSLWLAGRWYGRRQGALPATLLPLGAAIAVGGLACELISSGAFYFFSGRFAETSLLGFAERFVSYFPADLSALALWAGAAALTHAAATAWRGQAAVSER